MAKTKKLWQHWAKRMRREGCGIQEIADTFGKSVAAVHYHVHPNGKDKPLEGAKRRYYLKKLMSDPSLAGQEWVSWLSESP
jgi:hypothetical protein